MVNMFIGLFLVCLFCMILGLFIWGIWILVEILEKIQENKINPWIDSHFGESKE